MLTREEFLDWCALYEVNPWGERRADVRAAVQSVWNRGAAFADLSPVFPHIETDNDDLSEEDEAELIAMLDEINRGNDGTAGTAKPETDRVS